MRRQKILYLLRDQGADIGPAMSEIVDVLEIAFREKEQQIDEYVIQGRRMRSTITSRGQTVIPAEIRKRFHLDPSKKLEWIIDDGHIRVVPVVDDPIEAFRGRGKGGATARLLQDRRLDRSRE